VWVCVGVSLVGIVGGVWCADLICRAHVVGWSDRVRAVGCAVLSMRVERDFDDDGTWRGGDDEQ
jgi:hypothetical protein